jgi:hypothetical protein
MLFKLFHSQSLHHGRLDLNHPSGKGSLTDRHGGVYFPVDVEFVIPDDEVQGNKIRSQGFQVHTPVSMNLGFGSTGPNYR